MGGPQRYCTECGHELRPEAGFCTDCGHPAATSNQPAAQAGPDSGTRDSRATTRASASAGPDTSRRPRPPTGRAHPPPDGIGAIPAGPKVAGYEPLPRSDTEAPDQLRPHRSGPLLIIGLIIIVAAGIAAAAILTLHPFGHQAPPPATSQSRSSSPSATHPSSSPSPNSASGSLSLQHQAADSLAALVSQSAGDRNSVNTAYDDVMGCGPHLDQDIQTFRNSATSRQQLLSQLANMPARSALPVQMLQELTSAWQVSVEADNDFAAWAQDEASNGCATNQSDANLQAATGPDRQATADKEAFLRLWNPLAAEYSLTTYQQGDL